VEVTPEEEEEILWKIARKVHQYGMEIPSIMFLESIKPLSFIGAQMGRFFLSPFLPAFGEDIGIGGEKVMLIFEKRGNVERLIKMVEKLAQEEKERKEAKKAEKKRKKIQALEQEQSKGDSPGEKPEKLQKKGWRRFIPF
jgi:hypothetical protein